MLQGIAGWWLLHDNGRRLALVKSEPDRWGHLQTVPMSQLWMLLLAIFLLSAYSASISDVVSGGTVPYALVILYAILSGLNSMAWVITLAKLPRLCVGVLIVYEFFNGKVNAVMADGLTSILHPPETTPSAGLQFAGTAILILVISSYSLFTRYMSITGKEAYRIKNELELAHSIQKTLVPPIMRNTRCFEIYGHL